MRADTSHKHTADTQANPLLLACLAGRCHGDLELLVCLAHILSGLLGILVDSHNRHLLLGEEFLHVVEEIHELDQALLDLQHLLVALLDSTQHAIRLFRAASHDGLLEDLRVAVHDLGDFGIAGVGVGDPGLALHAALHLLAGSRLNLLELLDSPPQVAVRLVDLSNIARMAAFGVGLDIPETDGQGPVLVHY